MLSLPHRMIFWSKNILTDYCYPCSRPNKGHTEIEEALHDKAHIDYDRVAIIANPSVAALYEDALVYETGSAITASGALSAYSGAKTGRSPSDKRIVEEETSKNDVWWGPVNKPMKTDVSTFSAPVLERFSFKPIRKLAIAGWSRSASKRHAR
jgi:hypothetical protein